MQSQVDFSDKPKSAARLAAEAAFFQTPGGAASPAGPAPVVTIISRKLGLPETPLDAAGTADDAAKPPRVFLLNAPGGRVAAPAAAPTQLTADAAVELPSAWANERGTAEVSRLPRRRRRRHIAEPGRVIYSAPVAAAANTPQAVPSALNEAAAAAMAAPVAGRIESALSALDATFATIRAAQTLEIIDPLSARERARLAAAADGLARELRALLAR